jgi:hypothetical protein
MILAWLDGREAAEIGTELAEEFAPQTPSDVSQGSRPKSASGSMDELLRRADSEVRPLHLNFYKKAKFANSFKWRLIENGVSKERADEVTQSLVLHLSQDRNAADTPASSARPDRTKAQQLFNRGNKAIEQRAFEEAAAFMSKRSNSTPRMRQGSTI